MQSYLGCELLIGAASQGTQPCPGDRGRGVKNVLLETSPNKQLVFVPRGWAAQPFQKAFQSTEVIPKQCCGFAWKQKGRDRKFFVLGGTPLAN